jgi:rod shape determining protein RodA
MAPPRFRILQQSGKRRQALGFSVGGYLRSMDWVLLGATLLLSGFGLFVLFAATHKDANISTPYFYVRSQAIGLVLGLAALMIVSVLNYRWLARWRVYIWGAALLLLVLTLVPGIGAGSLHGANRWIDLRVTRVQTSELVKMMLTVALAAVLAEGTALRHRFRFVVVSVVFVLVPTALVFLQPDLGTALVFGAILVTMLVVWGIRLPHLGILAGAGAFAGVLVLRILPALGITILKGYQMQRLTVFLDPEKYKGDLGYQLYQSKIAIGSGMFTGKGWLQGTQTTLNFLPEHHTDFIYAVIGEEFGFLGCVAVLGLFAVIIWRAFRIARMADDMFGRLIATGIGGVLVFEVFVNVGMTIGIMPVTGIPLPFVSFGSSSLVVFLMMIGLLESVHVHSVAGQVRK